MGELYGERLYCDGKDPQLLETIEIGFLQPAPRGCHREDHRVNARQRWVRRGLVNRWSLYSALEEVKGCLWFDGGSSSNGKNDKIPAREIGGLTTSLKLIQPNRLLLKVQMEGTGRVKPRRAIRGSFTIAGFDYTLSVTDSFVEDELRGAAEGTTLMVTRPMLCISVGEVYEKTNFCYKLIAGVVK